MRKPSGDKGLHHLTKLQRSLITGIARAWHYWATYDPCGHDNYSVGDAIDAESARHEGCVRFNPPAWLQRPPTPSLSASVSREVRRLEERGFLIRESVGDVGTRTTHVFLSQRGRRAAIVLAHPRSKLAAFLREQEAAESESETEHEC